MQWETTNRYGITDDFIFEMYSILSNECSETVVVTCCDEIQRICMNESRRNPDLCILYSSFMNML